MLQRWNSRTPLVGSLIEHECPRCHQEVELPLGALCESCRYEIDRRARKAARPVALVSTLAVGLYVFIRVPADGRARLVGAAAVVIWYILTNLVVRRVMIQWER